MRLLLLTGSGGAGTTTLAAAIAVGSAARGVKTRWLAVDAAAAAELLGPDGAPDGPVAGPLGDAADVPRLLDDARRDGVLAQLGIDAVPPDLVGRLPGLADLVRLEALARAATDDCSDLVVADLGPSTGLLDLLAGHDALRTAVRHGFGVSRRVERAIALPNDPLIAAVDRLTGRLDAVAEVLAAPSTALVLVTRPGRTARAAVRRALPQLAMFGVPAAAVFVRGEGDGIAEIAELAEVVGLPPRRLPDLGREPIGSADLLALLERTEALDATGRLPWIDPDPVDADRPVWGGAVERPEPPEQQDAAYVLVLPLPLAERAAVTAARLEDDLVVGVGERSRVVTLPSVLRRCHVRDAVLEDAGTADAVLRVRFEPDPALWRS